MRALSVMVVALALCPKSHVENIILRPPSVQNNQLALGVLLGLSVAMLFVYLPLFALNWLYEWSVHHLHARNGAHETVLRIS